MQCEITHLLWGSRSRTEDVDMRVSLNVGTELSFILIAAGYKSSLIHSCFLWMYRIHQRKNNLHHNLLTPRFNLHKFSHFKPPALSESPHSRFNLHKFTYLKLPASSEPPHLKVQASSDSLLLEHQALLDSMQLKLESSSISTSKASSFIRISTPQASSFIKFITARASSSIRFHATRD
ncbi:hypothetical protein PoB_006276200 [Plakobranchus ocellatus]|uniref:Uncharacterized protein n=1 Tax=Plakobranchus ocellatus TaxID=259542 RepID=A0AAV4CWG4_9GAST|nr:hypothetical protein PoB_006276200 [Plakobranchus ocellatus]